ncbi:hypothetical protein MAR_034033, partial [Mya arenaria]
MPQLSGNLTKWPSFKLLSRYSADQHASFCSQRRCVSKMIKDLKWMTLEQRRRHSRLHMIYKINENCVYINADIYLRKGDARTTGYHRLYQERITDQTLANTFFSRTGNDIVMEFNHVHHTCMNASDCGAFHTGRDWTTRGNVIRNNLVHDNLRLVPGADVRGVMLDDQSSSTHITNNVFFNNDVHVNIGGGRDNVVSGNVMYGAERFSMQVDGRGLGRDDYKDFINHRLH